MNTLPASLEVGGPDWLLDPGAREAVLALAATVEADDGVAASSEGFVLALGRPGRHVLAVASAPEGRGSVVGYAGVAADGSAELFVDPGARRRGVGRDLWRAATSLGAERVWAHGDLPGARAMATSESLERARELHLMSRPLSEKDAAEVVLPQGFSARAFRPGEDDEAWVTLNAAAFAHHREQGALTLEDLHERMALDWFDPEGFIVVEDEGAAGPGEGSAPVAFHWTKVETRSAGSGDQEAETAGEVYVVGVHPAYHSRGLARPLTRLGIAHLARRGLARVDLYVDGDNAPALATYAREGFAIRATDVMYAVPAARMTP